MQPAGLTKALNLREFTIALFKGFIWGIEISSYTKKKGRLQHGFLMEGISHFESCILTIE